MLQRELIYLTSLLLVMDTQLQAVSMGHKAIHILLKMTFGDGPQLPVQARKVIHLVVKGIQLRIEFR